MLLNKHVDEVLKDTNLCILKDDDGYEYKYNDENNDDNIDDDREIYLNNISQYDSYSSPKRSENFDGYNFSITFYLFIYFLNYILSIFLVIFFFRLVRIRSSSASRVKDKKSQSPSEPTFFGFSSPRWPKEKDRNSPVKSPITRSHSANSNPTAQRPNSYSSNSSSMPLSSDLNRTTISTTTTTGEQEEQEEDHSIVRESISASLNNINNLVVSNDNSKHPSKKSVTN